MKHFEGEPHKSSMNIVLYLLWIRHIPLVLQITIKSIGSCSSAFEIGLIQIWFLPLGLDHNLYVHLSSTFALKISNAKFSMEKIERNTMGYVLILQVLHIGKFSFGEYTHIVK